jgi:starch synthase (maltosyl-transferring)
MTIHQGFHRVIIEGVKPEIDAGTFPIKRTVGEQVVVQADVFTDGHDAISALLLCRKDSDKEWCEVPMASLVNDRWQGRFTVAERGRYVYTVTAWVDPFKGWQLGLSKKVEAEQDVAVDLLIGANLIEAASRRASGVERQRLGEWVDTLRTGDVASSLILNL